MEFLDELIQISPQTITPKAWWNDLFFFKISEYISKEKEYKEWSKLPYKKGHCSDTKKLSQQGGPPHKRHNKERTEQ